MDAEHSRIWFSVIYRPEYDFDGAIGIWPIVKVKTAQRNSKFHRAGDEYDVPDTLKKKGFQQMLKTDVIPAIIERVGLWADRVVVQLDSAGGHGVKQTTNLLNEYSQEIIVPVPGRQSKTRTIKIEFIAQPTRSPDLNVLDLGAWYSLQSVVEECRYEADPTKKLNQRLVEVVLAAWQDWQSAKKLTKLFSTLNRVVTAVVNNQGGNQFNLRDV